MKNFRIITRYTFILLSFIMCTQLLNAQGTQASIIGVVSDDTGETLPGATVIVKNESTGFTTGTTTNINGEYAFRQLPLGSPYTVTVTYIGYGGQSKTGYELNQSNTLMVDFVLKDESVQFGAVVVVGNSLKSTASSFGVATQVKSSDIARLPVNGRNFATLIDLSPLSSGTIS